MKVHSRNNHLLVTIENLNNEENLQILLSRGSSGWKVKIQKEQKIKGKIQKGKEKNTNKEKKTYKNEKSTTKKKNIKKRRKKYKKEKKKNTKRES